eukprot:3940833-Rhodomonas_salina.4
MSGPDISYRARRLIPGTISRQAWTQLSAEVLRSRWYNTLSQHRTWRSRQEGALTGHRSRVRQYCGSRTQMGQCQFSARIGTDIHRASLISSLCSILNHKPRHSGPKPLAGTAVLRDIHPQTLDPRPQTLDPRP